MSEQWVWLVHPKVDGEQLTTMTAFENVKKAKGWKLRDAKAQTKKTSTSVEAQPAAEESKDDGDSE